MNILKNILLVIGLAIFRPIVSILFMLSFAKGYVAGLIVSLFWECWDIYLYGYRLAYHHMVGTESPE